MTVDEIVGRDYCDHELAKQQIRSLDSIGANIEEGYGCGLNKQLPQHLKIARGEARESKGRYRRMKFFLSADIIHKRLSVIDQIIGGLTTTINTVESKRAK